MTGTAPELHCGSGDRFRGHLGEGEVLQVLSLVGTLGQAGRCNPGPKGTGRDPSR